MGKAAILLSGHTRNIHGTVANFKKMLLDPILTKHEYDIYVHTLSNNISGSTVTGNDRYYRPVPSDIKMIFTKHNILPIKRLLIENQTLRYTELGINAYIAKYSAGKDVFPRHKRKEVLDVLTNRFWSYYDHSKVFNLIDNPNEYDYIIKTRPDMLYCQRFDIRVLNQDVFFSKQPSATRAQY